MVAGSVRCVLRLSALTLMRQGYCCISNLLCALVEVILLEILLS